MPRNQFRQAVQSGGPARQPYSYSVPSPHIDCLKIPAQINLIFMKDTTRHEQKFLSRSVQSERYCTSGVWEFYNQLFCVKAVLRIHEILVWIQILIRIRGSIHLILTNGCGSGSCYVFVSDLQDINKIFFFSKIFCLLLFEATFTSFFHAQGTDKHDN